MNSTNQHEEEEEEDDALVSDLVIAAKFATMDVYNTAVPSASDDPCEIDLDEVVPYDKPSTAAQEESSSSSDSEEEEDDVEMYHKSAAAADNESEDDMEVESGYVPYLETSSSCDDVEITDKDTVISNTLVISAIHLKSNLLVVSASEKANGKPQILDSGSVVCTNTSRQVLGRIDDVFGPVDLPHYTIVCSEAKMVSLDLKVGDFVGRVDNMTSLVNIAQLDTHGIDRAEEEEGSEDSDDDDIDRLPVVHKKSPPQQRVVKKKKQAARPARPAKPPQVVVVPPPVQQQQQLPPNWPQ